MQPRSDAGRRVGYVVLMVAALLVVALSANLLSSGIAPTSTAGKSSGPGLDRPLGAALSSGAAQAPVKANPSAQQIGQVNVIRATHADTSIALRDMPPAPALPRKKEGPENPLPFANPVGPVKDTVVQDFFGLDAMPTPIANWAGIQFSQGGTGWPPDTNADVGNTHVVETVNGSLKVWTKDGTAVYGPVYINTIWSGFGGYCQNTNDGDPIVLHDQIADRWLVSQFVVDPPFGQCVAVSATGDPTGSWHRYYFQFSDTQLLYDYPKFGVWPDGYYFTANRFRAPSYGYDSPIAGVFERAKMLTGDPTASYQEINPGNFYGNLLPADLDGSTLPPAGAPNYLATTLGTIDTMRIWRYHVDWGNPANSSLTGPFNVTVAPFDPDMCGGNASCVRQPGTSTRLDALAGRLMHRLAYRNFGSHETLVGSSTVDVNGQDQGGIRWYEVRNPGSSPTLYQQGTYAPDATTRWMPSIAMDRDGNIAVSYSVSNNTDVYPGIRYAGRLATDPLGQLAQGEATLIDGTGSQSGINRWGDYSSLTIDPVDDCTFWIANEYYATTGSNWQTRIGSFKFPGCGSTTPTPTRTGTPPTATSTATPTYTVTPVPSVCANYTYTTGTGTMLPASQSLGVNCDDCARGVQLPFPIQFYDQTFNSATLTSNGVMALGSPGDYAYGNDCLPVEIYNYAIMAFWDDIYMYPNVTGAGIFTDVSGTAPNRTYHVRWKGRSYVNSQDVDVEVQLHENSTTFDIVYGQADADPASATIGVQALYTGATTRYTQVSCNTGGLTAGTKYTFTIAACPQQTATPTPTACNIQFTDVPPDNTFYPFVRCLACQGIINGYPCGGPNEPCDPDQNPYFRPNNYVTRGQLAKIVSESAGFSDVIPPSQWTFTDVPYGSTFWLWVERLAGRGVMSGYACGIDPNEPCDDQNRPYFRPGNGATRGQLTKIVSNAAGFDDTIPPGQYTFTDVQPSNTFWVFVERLLLNRPGVMGGYPCGGPGEPCDSENRPYFRPNNPLTRGQTSKIVSNTFFPDCQP